MIKTPDTIIIILVLDCSDNFDHKYIKKNMVKGTPKPNIMYFGILIYLTYLIDLINAFNCSHVNKNLK